MDPALRGVGAVVGDDEDQRQHAQNVGDDGDRDHGEDEECHPQGRSAPQVRVEEAQRDQAHDRVETRARVGDQHLAAVDRDHHAAQRDGVSHERERVRHDRGHQLLQGIGERVQHEAGQRHVEGEEGDREREPRDARPPPQEQRHPGGNRQQRPGLDRHQRLRAPEEPERETRENERESRARRRRADAGERVTLAPYEERRDREDQRSVRVRIVAPCPAREVHERRPVEQRQPRQERHPGAKASGGVCTVALLQDRLHRGPASSR